jgi:hypothetical protein
MSNQIQKEFQYICSPQGMSGKDEGPPISGASPMMNHRNMIPIHSKPEESFQFEHQVASDDQAVSQGKFYLHSFMFQLMGIAVMIPVVQLY